MGKKIKKGTRGEVNNFVSRAKVLRVLNIPLKDFRRICILKGIYPRQPKKRLDKTSNKTYYHVKDIKFLKHEILLDRFKEIRAYNKKIEKYTGRKNKHQLEYLRKNKPSYTIDHLVRERYSSFNEALNDLGDCISTLILLSSLPSHRWFKINPDVINKSQNLIWEFKKIIEKRKMVTKVFLSIKGVYYECMINDIKIIWLEPYNYSQNLKFDVDYKVILSFSEFYFSMLKFINFKLYNDFSYLYPPKINEENVILEESKNTNNEEDKFKISEEFKNDETIKKILKKEETKGIFENLNFFISREVDKKIFEFLIKCQGGNVFHDLDNFESKVFKNSNITHVITDRPANGIKFLKNIEYIQPQWICDSINHNILLNVDEYKPGSSLPAHLSPFTDSKETGYKPEREKEIEKFKGEYVEESIRESDLEDSEVEKIEDIELENEKKEEFDYKVEKNIKKKKISKKDKIKSEKEKEKLAKTLLSNKKLNLIKKKEEQNSKKNEKNKNLKRKAAGNKRKK